MLSLFKFPFTAWKSDEDAEQSGMDFTYEMKRRIELSSAQKAAGKSDGLFNRLLSIICRYRNSKRPDTPEEAYDHYRRMLEDIEKSVH
ncbi:MAG: hypothetical protein KatS3mg029_0762 [Saprospiraceae bacterium]|nr:MAG: hypothetical protein KatS3mg029_0762 [Saprospiraceae bacterium]